MTNHRPHGYWQLLIGYLRPYWRQVSLLIVILLVGIALQLVAPRLIRTFIDTAMANGDLTTLTRLALMFLGAALLAQVIIVVETYLAENVGLRATNQMRSELALHVLQLGPDFHAAHVPGELIERVDGDVSKLSNFFSRFVGQILGNGLLLIGVLALTFQIDWRIGTVLTLVALLAMIIMYRLRNVAIPYQQVMRQADADLFGFLEEHLSGTEDIRANGANAYVLNRLYRWTRNKLHATRWAYVIGSATFNSSIIFLTISSAVGLGMGIALYSAGSISLGTIYLIYAYTDLLRRPIEQLSRQFEDLQQAMASIGRLQELFAQTNPLVEGHSDLPAGPLDLAFEHVTFGYKQGQAVMQDISFSLAAGQTLGVIGPTGSGKTSITRLLLRLYDPWGGLVQVGGIDLRMVRWDELRRRIAMVTQDVQIFHATVRDNLTLFDRSIDDLSVLAALKELGLDTWLQRLPNGLDTMLAPDGMGLSAGEAQLLAFARVFLRDPGLVILDEASSRLDPATEQVLERAIDRLLYGRTAIIIAHRLRTIQRTDMVLIVEQGRAREYGAREVLTQLPESRLASLLRTAEETTV